MSLLTNRNCAGCKFFRPGRPNSECRRYPPVTQSHVVGMKPDQRGPQFPPQPILHMWVGYAITAPELECGEWQQGLARANQLDLTAIGQSQESQ